MGFPRINLNKPDDWVAGVKAYARDHELTRPLRVAEQGVSGASPLLLITLGLMAGFSVAAVNVAGGDAAGAAAAAALVAGANAAADADTVPLGDGDGRESVGIRVFGVALSSWPKTSPDSVYVTA
jgi:hypothetical protein